ncbi:HAD family hydrolase [Haploplasma axanthum]|nr:HAD family hydrolase [Haploplasma axanthum]
MKNLIALDLDDTLLTSQKNISPLTKEAIINLSDKGYKFVIATGRSFNGAKKYHKELNLETPIVSNNGSLVTFPDGKKLAEYMPESEIKDIIDSIKEYAVTIIINLEDSIHSHNFNKELEVLFNGASINEIVELDFNNIPKNVLNLVVLINEENRTKFEKIFENKRIKQRYWGTYDGECFYDLYLSDISKYSALKKVLNHYNLTKDDLIAFGDSSNDIEMLSNAKIGIAMKNAHKHVKEKANEETDFDNNNDGIGHYLKTFI